MTHLSPTTHDAADTAPLAQPAEWDPANPAIALGMVMMELLAAKVGTGGALLFAVRATEATRPGTPQRAEQDRIHKSLVDRIGAAVVTARIGATNGAGG